MKNKMLILPGMLMLACMAISCGSQKRISGSSGEQTHAVSPENTKTIIIDAAAVDSLVFIPLEGEPVRMEPADCKLLSEYLSLAEYDTRLNSGDIMIKMQAPDYTAVFYYKGKSPERSGRLMIWNENGRTKFADRWYYLGENTRSDVYKLFDKYAK